MSASSNYLEAKLLDHALGTTTFTKPTTVYVALFTGTPATNLEAGTLSDEVTTSASAYARQAATFASAASPGGTATTSATITFPTATASWGTITYLAILDGGTAGAGNVLFYGALDSSKLIETGDTFQIQSGNLTVTLA